MPQQQQRPFYGWWITAFAFLTFGIAVGIPYYGGPFFYDYYEKAYGWKRSDITFGFPLASLLTLWVGPLLVHRFQPRTLIPVGTALTGLAFILWSQMNGSLWMYWGIWVVYTVGYIFSGPIAHQILTSQWFKTKRGQAMAIVYLGVGVFGGISAKVIARPLTEALGFQTALLVIGCLMFIAWPVTFLFIKNKPSDIGQFPDGADHAAAETRLEPQPFSAMLSSKAFWLLLIGSTCSIGAIGSINQHMKFVFKEQGFADQSQLNAMFADATLYILFSSIGGRLFMGWLADRYSKKIVMVATYALVAATIPLLLLVRPENETAVYLFSILFGFGMGADYMLIPLMAAEQFGVNSLARAMAIILPTDTIGQTWFPFLVAKLHENFGGYGFALNFVFALSAIGALAIMLLPSKKADAPVPVLETGKAVAGD
ncbi:MAG: MFS transporter [Bryobacteraceae bacterium]|nr:MFS transporter [Bryobacteraceae bacterium]